MRINFAFLWTISLSLLMLSPDDSYAQETVRPEVEIVSFGPIEDLMANRGDTLYIINFWATWCKPCILELPYFEQIHEEYAGNSSVRVILVSLDFPEKLNNVVTPFLLRNSIDADVWLLDEQDANRWIDLVDKSWSGAIPATLFLHRNYRSFHEGSLTYEDLKKIITNPKLKL